MSAGRPASLPLRVAPIAAAFAVVGVVFLYGHSLLRYAPNYDPPATETPSARTRVA